MANKKISELTPKGSALAGTDLLEVSVFNGVTYDTKSLTGANVVSGLQPTLVSGTNIKTINSTSLLGSGDIVISSGLTIGTTPIALGTIGRVLFEGTGNVLQQDSTLFWDNTNKRLGVGATPSTSVLLDLRTQGALSTDIALRVRNSANTANILTVNGKGQVWANGKSAIVTNTAFGEFTLDSLTTAVGNTAFGYEAIKANLTATGNSAFGQGALQLTTGQANTAIGFTAGQSNGAGSFNTYLGYQAGKNGTTATSGVFIGSSAGQNSNGSQVICIGENAGLSAGTGSIAIGNSAGTGTGTHNISLGQSSSLGTTTGSFNIQIGYRTVGSGITTGNNNTLIGGQSVVGAVSNNVAISDGAGNKVLWFNSVNAMISDLKIDTVTGIKIGTATTNKLAFWNATPIVQPTTATTPATVVNGTGGNIKHDDTFDGYTLEKVVRALRNIGLLA